LREGRSAPLIDGNWTGKLPTLPYVLAGIRQRHAAWCSMELRRLLRCGIV
jgi:hypothetical protein